MMVFISFLSRLSTQYFLHVLDQVSKISRHRSFVVHFAGVKSSQIIEEKSLTKEVASQLTSNWRTHTWGFAPSKMPELSSRACLSSTMISFGKILFIYFLICVWIIGLSGIIASKNGSVPEVIHDKGLKQREKLC